MVLFFLELLTLFGCMVCAVQEDHYSPFSLFNSHQSAHTISSCSIGWFSLLTLCARTALTAAPSEHLICGVWKGCGNAGANVDVGCGIVPGLMTLSVWHLLGKNLHERRKNYSSGRVVLKV